MATSRSSCSKRPPQPGVAGDGQSRVAETHEQRADVAGLDLVGQRGARDLPVDDAGQVGPARRPGPQIAAAARQGVLERPEEPGVEGGAAVAVEAAGHRARGPTRATRSGWPSGSWSCRCRSRSPPARRRPRWRRSASRVSAGTPQIAAVWSRSNGATARRRRSRLSGVHARRRGRRRRALRPAPGRRRRRATPDRCPAAPARGGRRAWAVSVAAGIDHHDLAAAGPQLAQLARSGSRPCGRGRGTARCSRRWRGAATPAPDRVGT